MNHTTMIAEVLDACVAPRLDKKDDILQNIVEFVGGNMGTCTRCHLMGQVDRMGMILNYRMLWRCPRCDEIFCYHHYEPRDGHMCFEDDWIVGKGYRDINSVGDFFQYLGPKGSKPDNWDEICSALLRESSEEGHIHPNQRYHTTERERLRNEVEERRFSNGEGAYGRYYHLYHDSSDESDA